MGTDREELRAALHTIPWFQEIDSKQYLLDSCARSRGPRGGSDRRTPSDRQSGAPNRRLECARRREGSDISSGRRRKPALRLQPQKPVASIQ